GSTTRDEQEHRFLVSQVGGLLDLQFVVPGNALPDLGAGVESVDHSRRSGMVARLLPGENRVVPLHVIVEIGTGNRAGRACQQQTAKSHEQGANVPARVSDHRSGSRFKVACGYSAFNGARGLTEE